MGIVATQASCRRVLSLGEGWENCGLPLRRDAESVRQRLWSIPPPVPVLQIILACYNSPDASPAYWLCAAAVGPHRI